MPMQQQNSSFAGRLGARVAQANAEHKDKPIDTGNRRLPSGIKNGRAKLSSIYTKQQTEGNGRIPKGETFFRASAVVESPVEHNGIRVAGMVTQVIIPLCDIPAKGQTKAKSFSENWFEFQNLFKLLGVAPPNEQGTDEAAGRRIEAYYFAAMKMLTDPARPPVYIEFSTRGWTPPKTPLQPNPEELVFETWHGLWQGPATPPHDPATSVSVNQVNGAGGPPTPSEPFEEPPRGVVMPDGSVQAPDLSDEVASLVTVAMDDPDGATEEGAAASKRLEDLAWKNGWTEEQTKNAANWEAVGDMALNPPPPAPAPGRVEQVNMPTLPVVGSRWKFAKRTKEGAKLKNSKGEEFPPQEVEVVTVNTEAKTCTLKTVKDGKDVVDIRSKQPIAVKWEWLE